MGDMWRSQKMQLVQMMVQNDAAHLVVSELGKLGKFEFRDMNADTSFYKRSFVDEVRKCDELLRILRTIEEELSAKEMKPTHPEPSDLSLKTIEPKIHDLAEELANLKETQDLLLKNHNSLEEQKIVLELGAQIYATSSGMASEGKARTVPNELMALSEFSSAHSSLLGQVSGVINAEAAHTLERVLFRATRGNAVFQSAPVKQLLLETDAKTGGEPEEVQKIFFMVLFAGEVMRDKISKVCSHFGASLYQYPEDNYEREEMLAEVNLRLEESSSVLDQGQKVLVSSLRHAASCHGTWTFVVTKEKMVYDALNMCKFDIKGHVFISEGWVPIKDYDLVVQTLMKASVEAGLDTRPVINKISTKLTPPTYIPVNKFTTGFQALVNTYGTPRYREANPGAFACIMFPFLFGIMFGDFGHGTLLALFGYWLVTKEKEWDGKPLNDMVAMCYGGRYVIMLNGIFGAYVGFMYNEVFAFPMNWFGGSHWVDGHMQDLTPYPVGIDPIWHYTQNKITFFNSFKMKISIIVGVLQMCVGIILSLLNHIEYKDYKKVFFQFIPEFVFFNGIFGYLVVTIFYKWATDWTDAHGDGSHALPAPSLLTMLINMFMSPTADIAEPLYGHQCFTDCAAAKPYCHHESIFKACAYTCGDVGAVLKDDILRPSPNEFKVCFSELQSSIQISLLLAAFISVPLLLLPIPFIEAHEHAKAKKYSTLLDEDAGHGGHGEHGEEFSFGDAFIHQAIHTIEFVLGSISNTASYLRLWALSLAHSQLAELFKEMILVGVGLKLTTNPILGAVLAWFTFAAWAVISMVVLMVMENLSSFLHALRLQWVEFQNKFFCMLCSIRIP